MKKMGWLSCLSWVLGVAAIPGAALAQYATAGGTYTEGTSCVGIISIGSNAPGLAPNATGCDAIAMGVSAKANSGVGGGNNTTQYSAPIALGAYSSATGLEALAIGHGTVATGNLATAIGNTAVANGTTATALGASSSANAAGAAALGTNASASAANATAIGSTSISSGVSSVAVGNTSRASNINATAMGFNANASGRDSLALGSNSTANGSLSTDGNPASGFALAIGSRANSAGSSSMAIGGNSIASGTKALALGDTASSTATRSVAIGANASSTINSAVAIGNGTTATANVGDVSLGSGSTTAVVVGTGSVTVGGNTYAVVGTSPTSTVSVGTAGSQRTITNVAAGRVSATSTDAVNGSELYATNQQVDANTTAINHFTNGAAGLFVSDSSVTSTQPVSSGANAASGGFGASATGAASTVVGNQATDNGVADSTVLGQGASVSSGLSGSNAALGQGAVAYTGAQGSYAAFGLAPAQNSVGEVSVGSTSGQRQVTNVAAGSAATDAVNVAQLQGAASNLGTSISNVLGGTTSYNPAAGVVAGGFTYGGNTYSSVQNVFNAITGNATTHANSVAIGTVDGSAPNDAVNVQQLQAGVNNAITTANNYTDTQIANVTNNNGGGMFKSDPTGATSASPNAAGNNSAAGGAGASAVGNNSTAMGNNSTASADDSVALGQGSVADRANTVSVGTTVNARQITNVAAGIQTMDAVNVGQLNTGIQTAENWAKNYTDQKFQAIDQNINAVANRANAGVASGIAIASLGQAYQPNLSTVGVGVGSYHGEAGIAVGLSTISESGRYIFKLAATTNTRGDTGVGGSVNLAW